MDIIESDRSYPNRIQNGGLKDFEDRLQFARDAGCDVVILTGANSEPTEHPDFLVSFAIINRRLRSPFINIEIQTANMSISHRDLVKLRDTVGVKTISISVANIFSDDLNEEILRPRGGEFARTLEEFIDELKEMNFNVRLSVLLNDSMDKHSPLDLLDRVKELGANQATFRKLYMGDGKDNVQNAWVAEHGEYYFMDALREVIEENSREVRPLSFGQVVRSYKGIGVVLDDDCMARVASIDLRYAILRPNCKLYSRWEDKGSLIF
jgi:hypothetical protein